MLLLWRRSGHDEVFETGALLWRRARCVHVAWQAWGMVRPGLVLRGRLRGSDVMEVCRRCRGCAAAVGFEFRARIANMRFAWQAAGIVRAGRCTAGVPQVSIPRFSRV